MYGRHRPARPIVQAVAAAVLIGLWFLRPTGDAVPAHATPDAMPPVELAGDVVPERDLADDAVEPGLEPTSPADS